MEDAKTAWIRVGERDWALVDEEDEAYLDGFKWYKKEGYAYRFDEEKKEVRMHRQILREEIEAAKKAHVSEKGLKVIHKNGDLLDNRKENLEVTTNWTRYNKGRRRNANTSRNET